MAFCSDADRCCVGPVFSRTRIKYVPLCAKVGRKFPHNKVIFPEVIQWEKRGCLREGEEEICSYRGGAHALFSPVYIRRVYVLMEMLKLAPAKEVKGSRGVLGT